MIKAEPRTILYFLWNYFDVLKDIFDEQSKSGIVRKEVLKQISDKHKVDISVQLREYKIFRSVGEDFELRETYFNLFQFLLYEFKPILPEAIEKYYVSINEFFKKIRDGVDGDKKILEERIKNLSLQIREFFESVEKNTIKLLSESRDLKANVNKIDYRDKISKASFWIDYYILPLNRILDINHSESIASKLIEISYFSNEKRLNFSEETIRQEFEKLYNQLIQTNDDLLKQSRILTNELLPLIERIRTESIILTGWIVFLDNPYRIETPKIIKFNRGTPYSDTIYLNTKEFFEQFVLEESVYVDQDVPEFEKWIFNKAAYKALLKNSLPVTNFFEWCSKNLSKEFSSIDTDKFFALSSLLFEDDLNVVFSNKGETIQINTKNSKLIVPKIKIAKDGISKKSQADS